MTPISWSPAQADLDACRKQWVTCVALCLSLCSGQSGVPVLSGLVSAGCLCSAGIFTSPYEGRYLITAVLAPERDEYVEAVLSVSNASVAQLHTAGYRRELLEYHKPYSGKQTCGGPGTFHLVLHLKAGDEVNVVVTGGKLAYTDSDEMYSTFSGVLLYPSISHV